MLTSDLENPDLATVWRDQTFTFFNGVECPNVEVHGTGNVSHSQERIQLRHRFDANNVALESQGTKSTPGGPGDIQSGRPERPLALRAVSVLGSRGSAALP